MSDSLIYLDNHSTTRVDPVVIDAMLPFLTECYGNPGSQHAFGERSRKAIEAARESIAGAINATEQEIVFTSGATESNNLAFRGIAAKYARRGRHFITLTTEHRAVLDPLARLQRTHSSELNVLSVSRHDVDSPGVVDFNLLADAIRSDTVLVSVMLANNEIGVLQPIAEIAKLCHERGAMLHCDATQAVGKMDVDVRQLDVDLLSFSAHKIYGPRGIGALYVRRRPRVKMEPQIDGGGQQQGRRSGTMNTPGIVGIREGLGALHCQSAR